MLSKLKTQILKFFSFTLLLYVLSLTLFASSVSAQTATSSALPTSNLQPQYPSSNLPLPTSISPTSPLYTDLLVNNLFHSFSCLAIGQSTIGQPCLTYQLTKNAQGMIQSVPVLSSVNLSGGTLGAVTSVLGALYLNPPVRTADYLASVSKDFRIIKEAHAQGVTGSGANVLSPVIALWQVSRNISYVMMIIVFLVIGIMIMFRNKINPQTVITAQAALPGLVIGLILITFSYFLAGLISDMAFVGTNIVGYYFSAAQNKSPQNLVEDMKDQNVLRLFTPFTKVITSSQVANTLGSIWDDLADPNTCRLCPWEMDPQKALSALTAFMVIQMIMPFGGMFGGIGQIIGGIIAFGGTSLAPVQVASLALSFVAMVILIYAMFRLLIRLINNYITIIFLTITAPFQFLAASLPGRQGLATNWILNMLANILAFPAVIAVLYFVAFILGPDFIQPPQSAVFRVSQINQVEQESLVPTAQAQGTNPSKITGKAIFPLFGGLDLSLLNLLLAFGALVALPSIPDIIGRTIGRMGVAGQLIGQEISGSTGAGRGYASRFQQGVGGFTGQVGRITDEPHYYKDSSGKYIVNPQLSRAGVVGKLQGKWATGAATGAQKGIPWYKRFF